MIHWAKNILINGGYLATPQGIRSKVSGGARDPKKRVAIYERRVAKVVDRIYNGPPKCMTGWLLLNAIKDQGARFVTIVPPFRSIGQSSNAHRQWDRCRPLADTACTGKGTSATIWYEPVFWEKEDHHVLKDPFEVDGATLDTHRDRRSDDVLVHELFHALQSMTGTIMLGDTPEIAKNGWVSLREFHAILVENIYRAESGRQKGLRGDYDLAHVRLSSKTGGADLVASDKAFYVAYRREIDALYNAPMLNTFIGSMAAGFVPEHVWNPIHAKRIVEREEKRLEEMKSHMWGAPSSPAEHLSH
jgi:hypothetical protein